MGGIFHYPYTLKENSGGLGVCILHSLGASGYVGGS